MQTKLATIESEVGPVGAKLVILVLAALGATTILQSLSLKVGRVRIISLQELLDDYRKQVLEDVSKRNSRMERRQAFVLCDRLSELYDVDELREEYCQLLTIIVPEDAEKLNQEIDSGATLPMDKRKLLSMRVARMDTDRAKQLIAKRSPSKKFFNSLANLLCLR